MIPEESSTFEMLQVWGSLPLPTYGRYNLKLLHELSESLWWCTHLYMKYCHSGADILLDIHRSHQQCMYQQYRCAHIFCRVSVFYPLPLYYINDEKNTQWQNLLQHVTQLKCPYIRLWQTWTVWLYALCVTFFWREICACVIFTEALGSFGFSCQRWAP